MNDPSGQQSNRMFGMWRPPPIPHPADPASGPLPFLIPRPAFTAGAGATHGRVTWKGKKKNKPPSAGQTAAGAGGYRPPALKDLQHQNRVKARRFYRKFPRSAPHAPRNTSSFIMRAKKSGGIASLVSPCPVTPATLPTPKFSPSREGVVDMAKEEWGVDGYGSMNGLIRLRSPGNEAEDEASSESDLEEHVEVERRLDHDLSRFEMVYRPSYGEDNAGVVGSVLENRVDDQDVQIARLEEENLTLKERLFLMESEMGDLRRRLQALETGRAVREQGSDAANVNEAASDNEAGGNWEQFRPQGEGIFVEFHLSDFRSGSEVQVMNVT